MAANFGPGTNWPVTFTCDVLTKSPAMLDRAVASATFVLFHLTGQRYGLNSVKLRPCRQDCRQTPFPGYAAEPWPGRFAYAANPGGAVIAAGCGSCGDACSCTTLPEILLPGVVNTVTAVLVDGAPLTTAQYRLDNNRLLVRTDGQTWPYCQNLRLDDTQPGTFSVTAAYGEDIPDSAALAVGELACEFLKSLQGDDCRLPTSLTSLARQGVQITLPDLTYALHDKRQLGIPNVDRWIYAANPHGLMQRARTISVDAALARRTS